MKLNDTSAMRLDSDLLRTFLAVAEAGSVSAGAVTLLRTQSAVSLQVRKLEETVGQRLFHRHGRGVVMTAAGERLLPVARQVTETLDQTVLAMRGRQDAIEIRLGYPEEYGDTTLPTVLATFARRHPEILLFVRCGASTDFPDLLASGDLDLALHCPERVSAGDTVVHREAAVWAGSVFHDIAGRRPLPLALFDKACWWRERCLDLLRQSGLDHRVVCTSESVAGIRAAIAAGIAVGALPQSALASGLRPVLADALPDLGETSLVLSRSSAAPKRPTDTLAAIVCAAVSTALRPGGVG